MSQTTGAARRVLRQYCSDRAGLRDEESTVHPRHAWYLPLKVVAEFVFSVILLAIATPVISLAAILVRCTSAGPAFFHQTRVGKNGRRYTIHKLRTMVHNCEAESGAIWSRQRDVRVTPVGRFLRATHIDELPQLWNVLCGEMSLVGPRPERPELVARLERAIPYYAERLAVRPGITGLAQVQLGPDTDLETVRAKLLCDLFYVRLLNPWLDFRIVLCTAFSTLGIPFHVSRWIFWIPALEWIRRDGAGDIALSTPAEPEPDATTRVPNLDLTQTNA